VTATRPRRAEIAAPAKLNLGLEVVGKRPDGYHELATIFLTVDLCDHLTLHDDGESKSGLGSSKREAAAERGGSGAPSLLPQRNPERDWGAGTSGTGHDAHRPIVLICSDPTLATEENLALRALHALQQESGSGGGGQLTLDKRIPTAAGLGGASSDAAAALLAGNALWKLGLPRKRLAEIAAGLGSDVPFFLYGGCALGQGRGERLHPLPLPRNLHFVLVMPRIVIPRKTARLYASLAAEDFSDGFRVATQADRLRAGHPLDPALLGNAFSRALAALVPDLAGLPDLLRAAGAPHVALSGAGPTHYIPLTNPEDALCLAATIRRRLDPHVDVVAVDPVTAGSVQLITSPLK
jgi:4-diphosphocytidyl-2-C-methyl-D-erythritol kinase